MIPAFVSSLAAIGSIRRVAGLKKLRELLAEMGIRDMLSEESISWPWATMTSEMNCKSIIGWHIKKSRMIVCLDVEAIEIDEWGTIRNVSRYRIVWHLAWILPLL